MTIAVLGGDGIGPSVIGQAKKVLNVVVRARGHSLRILPALIGGSALAQVGTALPTETIGACQRADAILLGAVGDPYWDEAAPSGERPAQALLRLRQTLGLYANLRPVLAPPNLFELSYLKPAALGAGVDLMIVRDMSAGLFYGSPRGNRPAPTEEGGIEAFDTMSFTRNQVRRIAEVAIDLARSRRRHVTSVDQSNVLESGKLWRDTVRMVAAERSDVSVDHLFIDNCANELSRHPHHFDVIVTDGVFGGIISDQVAAISGSIGMLPSATVGEGRRGLFEPVHGSAPRYAGQDRVNPVGAIRSAALMLDTTFGLREDARAIERAVENVLVSGLRTYDIVREGSTLVGTESMGDAIGEELTSLLGGSLTYT